MLKTGKEADVILLQRAVPGEPASNCLLAAKRYRNSEHRMFHRDAGYTEGRRVRNSRDSRALAAGTAYGRSVAAGLWAAAEWAALNRLFTAGVPVPYPSSWTGPLFEQLVAAMQAMTAIGVVHGDLSPYNLLVA